MATGWRSTTHLAKLYVTERRSSLDSRSEIIGDESIGGKTSNRNKEVDEIHVDLLEDERNNDIKQEIRDDDVSSKKFQIFKNQQNCD